MKQFLHSLAITLCIALMATGAQAQTITAEQAKEIANNFFQNGKQKSAAARSTVSLAKSADSRILSNGSSNEAPTFHILTPASGEGFVIVSGEEIENPIIGYSLDGTIDTSNLPDGFVDYITDIDAQVKALRKYNAENPQKAAAARSAMQKTNYNATAMGDKVYLETASWGQDYPFNAQCFTSYNGSTNALTGCVPTAYAIIMRYHEWPQVGTGTLYNCQAPTYVEITDRTYDYSKMPLVYDGNWGTEQINEVAKLMSHLGHSFMVTYGSSQTSVSDPSNTDKPNKFFNYNLVYASYQANFTMDSWEEKIKESIDNGCPIPYASDNAGTGDTRHMFVLDGYTANDYFHFNFGWKGNCNGWFKLDAITPSQGDNYSWQDGADHYAIFNFTPNKTKYAVNASVSPENAGTVSINGSAAASSATGEYLQGATVTLAATANTGYTFQNWTKGGEVVSTNKSCQIKVASSDNDYVANFLTVGNTTVNVSVTYNSSYGTVTGTSGTVANGTTLTPRLNEEVTLTATPLDGYVFNGWTVTKGTESTNYSGTSLTFVATGVMSVQANFSTAIATYNISEATGTLENSTSSRYTTWSSSEVSGLYLTASYNSNAVEAISFNNGQVKLISAIYEDKTGTYKNPITYTLSAPDGYVITAYSMTYKSSSSNFAMTVANAQMTQTLANRDEVLTLSATGLSAQNTEFTVNGANTNYAIQVQEFTVTLQSEGGATPPSTQYTITATANPGTAGSVTGGGTYTEGATVTLTATPNSGYEFVNWTKGGIEVSTSATYSFTANATAEYVAHFQAAATTFAVTTTANPAAGGTATFSVGTNPATSSANVASGTGVTLYAVANDGYRFVNWTKGGMEVSTNATPNVTITEASDFVANFEETEEELPITGTGLDITFNGATGFPNSGNTNQIQTATAPVITISSDGSNIGFSTIDGVKHPYLFKNCSFTISVPEPYRIAGYKLTVTGHNFDQGTITYTAGAQLARSNTATVTIEGTTPKTVIATGLNNSEININVGNALETTAGVIITALEIDYVEEAQAGTFPDGAYKIFWQQNGRGYLAYHTGYPNEAKLADVTYPECQNKHFASTSPEVDLVWYLITAQDGNRYLFHAATGKFLAANADVSPTNTSKANKLSTTEALSIRIEENTAHSGHYVIMATVNSTDALLSSGCGTSSETGNPVRWWYDNANGEFMSDGGSPLQFVSTTADVSDAIMNQVRLVIDGVDITANAGEGGSVTINGEATGTKRVIKGSSVTLNATPASGYSFLNWSNTEGIVSETAEYTFTANSATTLTANFERITYTINVNANPGTAGTATVATGTDPGSSSIEVEPETSVTLTANANDGYNFTGWYNGQDLVSNENPYTFTATASGTYEARFEEEATIPAVDLSDKWFRLNSNNRYMHVKGHSKSEDNATCGSVNVVTSKTVNSNDEVFLFEKSGDGYKLKTRDGYYITCAEWNVDAYSTDEANGSVLLFEEDGEIYRIKWYNTFKNPDAWLYFKVGPDSGHTGDHPYGDAEYTAAATWVLEEVTLHDVTVTAAGTDGSAAVAVATGTATDKVEHGTSVTLTANANDGYNFTGWYNGEDLVTDATPYTFVLEGNINYEARFEVAAHVTYTISVSADPGTAGTASIGTETSTTVTAGEQVTLTAVPNSGYNFAGWYKGETKVSDATSYTFVPTESANYVARFEEEAAVGGGNDTVHNIVTNGTTGEVSELDGSFYKVWTSSNSPKIVLTSSGYTISTNNYELRLRAATYTLSLDNSVDEDLQIVSYTINYRKNSASSSITLSAEGEDDQTPGATTDLQQFVVDSFDPTRSTSFTVATGQAGQAIWVESIDVTIRSSAPTHYTVSVVSGEGGNAYIGASGTETETTIIIGSNVTLRAEVTEGYEFDGWYDSNGKFISDEAICTITPNDNMTYTAKFYALVEANKYYKLQCQGSNKYYLSSNINSADNNRLMMNGTNRIFYYGTLINEFDNIDDNIEANQKKLLAYTEGKFVGIKKRNTGDYYDVTLLDYRNEISHNVKFNAGTNGNVMISVEYVEYVDENEISTYFYLDGNGTSVGSNTNYINDNSHNWMCEEVTSLPVAISNVQHATLYAPVALEIPDGVRAYVLDASKIDGTSKDIVLTRLSSIIPANTGVILKGNEGTYYFNITESTHDAEAEAAGNALDGTVARTRVVGDAYILAVREGKVGLYPLATNSYINPDIQTSSFNNGSHKAYLPVKDDTLGEILKNSTGVRFIYSDEIVTGIQDGILYDGAEGESIYDLQGRKLSEITEPGIYIVNGKKRFIK